ncbi:MAG: aminoglycoside N(3)-acetyltransferase [Acidimicrobiales bacterium]
MSTATDPNEIAASIAALGPVFGRELMVHASMRKIGPIVGGGAGLIDAIMSVLGPEGTMVMMIAADDDEPFDRLTTEADEENGVLAEVFRQYPGVAVNDHPACRFAALGPAARDLLDPQPLHDYYGPGSPLERLYRRQGLVLRLGSDIDTVTLTHYAEYLADVPDKRTVARSYVRADSGELIINSLDDSDGVVDWKHGDYFSHIMIDFIAAGLASVGPVGGCTAELLDGPIFVDYAVEWMERHLQPEHTR